ncbi:MAG: fibronectin type III domain-containing protein [bacterium]|nr:fibronectin type III domain-containing protein [bacterium]
MFRTLPGKVKNVQITDYSDDCVSLKWRHVGNYKKLHYYIRFLDDDNFPVAYEETTENTLQHCGLNPSTNYKIKIKAVFNSANQGKYSKNKLFSTKAQ